MSSRKPKLDIEEPQTLASGETRVLLTNKVPLVDEDSQVYGVLGVYSDITERKKMEKEAVELRIEKEVLQEQNELTRILAASMAHELRTPLSAIAAGTSGLEKVLPLFIETYKIARSAKLEIPFIASMQLNIFSNILKNMDIETRGANMVIDMLLANTKSSDIDKSTFKLYSIEDCIKEAVTRYPLDDDEKKKIHYKKCNFLFHGDDILMTHVLFNLLKNSIYYIKAANKGEIQIWCDKNEDFNILHFKDTGLGIDADVVSHIFDRFYTRTRHGTGVGLAFCKLVMQSFDGDITCHSVKGEYTDFQMLFPIKS